MTNPGSATLKVQAGPLTLKRLVLTSLIYRWRLQLGVFLTVMLAACVLGGGLGVGTSVKGSLRQQALTRLGGIHHAVELQDRFFRGDLGERIRDAEPDWTVATLLKIKATAYPELDKAPKQITGIQLIGIDKSFAQLSGQPDVFEPLFENEGLPALLSPALVTRSGLAQGELKVRFALPSVLPRDAPLSLSEETQASETLKVVGAVPQAALGGFRLMSHPSPVLNIFVAIEKLQEMTQLIDEEGKYGKANVLLTGPLKSMEGAQTKAGSRRLQDAIRENWQLADMELSLASFARGVKPLGGDPDVFAQLNSDRIFMDDFLVEDILKGTSAWQSQQLLTYFVNDIDVLEDGKKQDAASGTPYSMVTAIEMPGGFGPHEIKINDWMAEDLGIEKVDDLSAIQLQMKYYQMGLSRKLTEKAASFTLKAILPLTKSEADRQLMPPFPGLAEVEDIGDWKPGIPIDLNRIRDKDEAYWDDYRGTPKAIIAFEKGKSLWGNRFGQVTAIRFSGEKDPDQLEAALKAAIDPTRILQVMPVRDIALEASQATTDFGGLFLGLSSFLIGAAITLAVLQFIFSIESRQVQLGTLKALGFTSRKIEKLILWEGIVVSGVASFLGGLAGLVLTHLLILGLNTWWRDAVAGTQLIAVAPWHLAVIAMLATWIVTYVSMWCTLKRYLKRQAQSLLSGIAIDGLSMPTMSLRRRVRRWALLAGSLIAIGIGLSLYMASLMASGTLPAAMAAGGSFGGGILILSALLIRQYQRLRYPGKSADSNLRYQSRQPGRSLTSSGVIAIGIFMVLAVAAFRIDPTFRADERDSGTGGFINWIELDRPLLYDLNSQEGRDQLGFDQDEIPQGKFVPMRIRPGDAASCLNLNKVKQPRLLGINPEIFAAKQAFRFSAIDKGCQCLKEGDSPWQLIAWQPTDTLGKKNERAIPAIVDMNTAMWALHKKIGDVITYQDEKGTGFDVQIVGFLDTSILQGDLMIDERALVAKFPSISGHQILLMDRSYVHAETKVPGDDQILGTLQFILEDYGLALTSTVDRLASFTQVQNTYLDIFQMLGLMGLLLGTCGLSLVVMRNVLERRSELALMQAVGYTRKARMRQLLREHALVLWQGIWIGAAASIVAIWPLIDWSKIFDKTQILLLGLPLITTIVSLLFAGILAIYFSCALALRGGMLDALRAE